MSLSHDRIINISVGMSRKATQWEQKQISISDFYAMLSTPRRSSETLAEYMAMPKAQQDDLKDVGGFVGGSLNGPRRKANNVTGRDVITLDFDNVPAEQTETVVEKAEALGCSYAIYTTRKHKPSAPRLRVCVPTDRTVTPDEYVPLARLMAAQIGMGWVDPTTFDVARLMYYPSCSADGEYIYRIGDKPLLSVDHWLNVHTVLYGEWHDPANWIKAANATEDYIRSQVKKQADPTEKNGIVGAFCRKYDIFRAMDELIPGTYTHCDNDPNRYTFVGGSTTGGAVIYDDGKFLYSHHATDPCSERLVNAFDLVRLHRFGDKDDNAAPGTPVGRLPSYTLMRDYAQSLPDVHIEAASAAADFANLENVAGEDESWKQQLDISQSGALKNSLNNIVLILEHDARFKGKLRKNLLHERVEVHDLPWGRSTDGPWKDTDTGQLRIMLEQIMSGKVAENDVYAAIDIVADKQAYHPVKAYLEGLVWDGIPRLDTLFIDFLGASDTPYTRAVARKSFVAAVARVMIPGCKYDTMCVLVGRQGRYKSTLLSIMGGQWFSDSLRTFEGQKADEQLRGTWLIEISELQGFKNAEVETIKGYLSRQTDRYRPAWGRTLREFPRQCVFFGTTNASDFLRDNTGGRRFWPIDIDQQERTKSVVNDLPSDRDQIWAEAVTRYRAGEPLYLTGEVEQAALRIQEDHREIDAWEGLLTAYLDKQIPEDWDAWPLDRRRDFLAGQVHFSENTPLNPMERQRVSPAEFLCEALNFAPGSLNTRDLMRVGKIMRGLQGWEPKQYNTLLYGRVRGYRRRQ